MYTYVGVLIKPFQPRCLKGGADCLYHKLIVLQKVALRAVTIYQYVAILQYDVSQYNSIHLLRHIDILRRAIYCSVLRVLYHKCAQ